ncbi:hypothetical protein DGMP_05560 [Desulfomarina profundi]|uniref:Response regulatory domain-containing protein n=2 Tax=Desulfomarina profundi TaxID=2772557 RepID=A0A8D5FEK4_9BACT|nr:hypothetical protein DGMP_05560 [Desulfomarina profundi]
MAESFGSVLLAGKKEMKKINVLVVEDEPDIQQLVSYNLLKAGFNVSCADSGEQALQILAVEEIDCVLLDLMLPGMSGLEICSAMKNEMKNRYASIPIIMLTARGEEEDVVTGLQCGADDYITKPFSPGFLWPVSRPWFEGAGQVERTIEKKRKKAGLK